MMHMVTEQVIGQVLIQIIGALLSAFIAAIGVGGVLWKKFAINEQQNQHLNELRKIIDDLLALNQIMSCHQLEMSCDRAIDRGCISLAEKQEIEKLYRQYEKMSWNGPGKVAYETMKKLPVREDF